MMSADEAKTGKTYLITGSNTGVGLEACRQLALRQDTLRIYLACRSKNKAEDAIDNYLVAKHLCPKEKLKYVHFDACDSQQDIGRIVASLKEQGIIGNNAESPSLDAVILNAGGPGDEYSNIIPTAPNGVINIVQVNLLGHIHLLDVLHDANLLSKECRIIFAGSESARGIPMFLSPAPQMGDKASFYIDFMTTPLKYATSTLYAATKGIGTLYFTAYARQYPNYKVLTVSPGGTFGTNALDKGGVPWIAKYIVYMIWMVAYFFGRFQTVDQGGKKYVDAVTGEYDKYESGSFLACSADLAGPICDTTLCTDGGRQYRDIVKQDAAYEAFKVFRRS